jgi:hypothetical protein
VPLQEAHKQVTVEGAVRGLTGDPEEDDALILERADVEFAHLVVGHGAVGQVLVDLPGRVGHNHPKLAQHRHVKGADVAPNPLRLPQRLQRTPLASLPNQISSFCNNYMRAPGL